MIQPYNKSATTLIYLTIQLYLRSLTYLVDVFSHYIGTIFTSAVINSRSKSIGIKSDLILIKHISKVTYNLYTAKGIMFKIF